NGLARGKRLPVSALPRLYAKGLCMPASAALVDISGEDVEGTGLVLESGDGDHVCHPVANALRPLPWSTRPGGQLLLHMHGPDGTAFPGDSRTTLMQALERLQKLGLTPVVATEFEFQ